MKYQTLELNLDEDTHPRRFLQLSNRIFVYGGETGDVVRLDDSCTKQTLIRQWAEDAVRAIAVSPNQRFVAVGLDSGYTQIYSYGDFDPTDSPEVAHPFVNLPAASSSPNNESLLSQSDTLSSPLQGEDMHFGPTSDTPIRYVIFLDDQYVVVASESRTFVYDVTQRNAGRTLLQEEIQKAHDGAGCRALEMISNDARIFATLGLDGRMSYWNCTAEDPSDWALLHRETSLCVPRKDTGEILGADAWDRSCRPVINSSASSPWLALPGASYWQWRKLEESHSKLGIQEHDQDAVPDSHSNAILAAIPCSKATNRFWISIGRDGRVNLWDNVRLNFMKMLALRLQIKANTSICLTGWVVGSKNDTGAVFGREHPSCAHRCLLLQ